MTRATSIQGQNLSEQTPGFGTTKTSRAASRASLVLALCAILLAPIWTVHYPPLVDYPNHLASAFVLAHLKDPAFHFSQFYGSDWNTYPYLAMDLILVGLQWFFPIDMAGRLFLSLCVLVVPLAVWFFIREANPGQDTLALWSLYISTGVYFFLDGLLNLQLGLALCFVVLGLWLRWLDRPRLTLWCLLLVATTALYFTHLVGFGVACFVATAYSILAHRRIREILLTWILFLAGILFYLHLVVHVRIGWTWGSHDFARKATGLLVVMLGYSPALDFLTLVAMVGCIILGRSGNPEFRWNHRWLGVAGCLFVLYWIFPGAYGARQAACALPFHTDLGCGEVRPTGTTTRFHRAFAFRSSHRGRRAPLPLPSTPLGGNVPVLLCHSKRRSRPTDVRMDEGRAPSRASLLGVRRYSTRMVFSLSVP